MAEGKGFEPLVRVNGRRFSRPVHLTTLPPLRGLLCGAKYRGSAFGLVRAGAHREL